MMPSHSELTAAVLFAGAGGSCEGIRQALGISPIVAVNHDEHAIRMHRLNHPETVHFQEDVRTLIPRRATSRAVDLLWASPDCKHFSRAKGGKPRDQGIRALAWVVVDWALQVQPSVIILENVREFLEWGPLDASGRPIKERVGETFRAFVQSLRNLGYVVEWRLLRACDFGTPTTRLRLYLIARRDGKAIRWPEPTHGEGLLPHRTAAECIDWSIPCPSIFGRKRPLAEKTQARIAEGVRRFVLETEEPFLLNLSHGGRLEPLNDPMRTVTATPKRGDRALIVPHVVGVGGRMGQSPPRSLDEPLNTVCAKNDKALLVPWLINTRNGERKGQTPRVRDPQDPYWTVTGKGSQGALVAAFVAKHNLGATGQPVQDPLHTITGTDTKALTAAWLTKFYGKSVGQEAGSPLCSITGRNKAGLVAAFLMKYYGTGGQLQGLGEPLHTVPSVDRFGLVTVEIGGEPYTVVDIGMRMLQPHELAAAQGFPPDYIFQGAKAQQVRAIGNAVCPPVARALVAAQFPEHALPSPWDEQVSAVEAA